MPDNDSHAWLDPLAKVLLRCFIFGFLLLLVWFAFFVFADDFLVSVHGRSFGLTRHEMAIIHYCGMAFVKLSVLLYFLFPYIAIRHVLRKQRT